MEGVVSELAKYIILLLTILYTYFGFSIFKKHTWKKRKLIYELQGFLILLIHFSGYLLLYFLKKDQALLWLYLGQLLFFVLSDILYRKLYPSLSIVLFRHMQFFLTVGFVFLARLSIEQVIKQTIFAAVGVFLCMLVPYLIKKLSFLDRLGIIYALGGLVLLALVFAFGKEVYGAKNWITIKGIAFQPSEFVKILYIFMIASLLSKKQTLYRVLGTGALAAAHVLLLVLEKDLGGALLFYVTFVIMVYVATKKYWYLLAGIGGGVIASVVAYQIFGHVRVRVLAWMDPWNYIDNEGYQITQSLFGIGTGGFFGMGLGKGLPTSIPVVDSDFIFAGIAEELGGLFAICLILIYIGSFLLVLNIAWKIKKPFHKCIAVGCGIMYSFQVFLSIGGATKFIPSTGVTLPFISYGGSSLCSMILLFSIIQGLYVLNNQKDSKAKVAQKPTSEKLTIENTVLSYTFMTLFVMLLLYFGYFVGIQSKAVINNSYNKRQELFAKEVSRGSILASDGTVLAYSIEKEDGETARVYPFKNLYSHIVGRIDNGKTGVEALMNFELLTSNDNPWKKLGEKMSGKKNKGDQVVTTIDVELQKYADEALGAQKGAIVILEPSTGKILAMVSKPNYDPNTASTDWEALTQEAEKESRLLNRAASGLYPPGSTFKLVTTLEYIREHPKGKNSYKNYSYQCQGTYKEEDYQIQCYNKTVHGKVDLKKAFSKSCNTAFASIGTKLSLSDFSNLANSLLFNVDLPANFPHKNSSFVLNENSGTFEIMQTAFGQGKTQITPLHNAMLAAAVANEGILMKPYVVDRVETYEGNAIKKYWPQQYGELMTQKEAKLLSDYMEDVVNTGTATALSTNRYDVSGKTGTAEYIEENGAKNTHSWFIGFAKKKESRIAISVIVEGENRGNKTGVSVTKYILDNWQP